MTEKKRLGVIVGIFLCLMGGIFWIFFDSDSSLSENQHIPITTAEKIVETDDSSDHQRSEPREINTTRLNKETAQDTSISGRMYDKDKRKGLAGETIYAVPKNIPEMDNSLSQGITKINTVEDTRAQPVANNETMRTSENPMNNQVTMDKDATFIIHKNVYYRIRDVGASEIESNMKTPGSIMGHVTDARTKKPIPKFVINIISPYLATDKRNEFDKLEGIGEFLLNFSFDVKGMHYSFSNLEGLFSIVDIPESSISKEEYDAENTAASLQDSSEPFIPTPPNAPQGFTALDFYMPQLKVIAPGYKEKTVIITEVSNETKIFDISYELEPLVTLNGSVKNEQGMPIVEALIFVEISKLISHGIGSHSTGFKDLNYGVGIKENRKKLARAITNSQGEFTITNVVEGNTKLYAYSPNYRYAEISTELRESGNTVNFVLKQGASIQGQVTRGQTPLHKVTVSASFEDFYQAATTDEQGRYELHGLPSGGAAMRFMVDDYLQYPEISLDRIKRPVFGYPGIDVYVEEEKTSTFDFEVGEMTSSIKGTVMQEPNIGTVCYVILKLDTGFEVITRMAETNIAGEFQFSSLPSGKFRLYPYFPPSGMKPNSIPSIELKFNKISHCVWGVLVDNESHEKDIPLYSKANLRINMININPYNQKHVAVLLIPSPYTKEITISTIEEYIKDKLTQTDPYPVPFVKSYILFNLYSKLANFDCIDIKSGTYTVVLLTCLKKETSGDIDEYEKYNFSESVIFMKEIYLEDSSMMEVEFSL